MDHTASAPARSTIFALSSGAPPCAIAIVRVSGPQAFEAAQAITGEQLPPLRHASLRNFRDADGALIDRGLLLCFAAEHSVTGEPLVEFHCHGSRAVVRALEAALAALPGLSAADAGAFTRQAFLNGRIDLAGVEGLGDLLTAETALQGRAAMAMLGGALSRRIVEWTAQLRRLAARIEAALDFADEGDVDEDALQAEVTGGIAALAVVFADELARPPAERLKEGIRTVIAGPPNAGKSTLLNALVGRDAAIVSPIAGTTRDVIEVPIALGGLPFLISDTAGLRETQGDEIEAIGIARATALLQAADIILWLGSQDEQPLAPGRVLPVQAKADLVVVANASGPCAHPGLSVSVATGDGMDALVEALGQIAGELLPAPGDYALSARQRTVLARARDAVAEGATLADPILQAEAVRTAMAALDELTGRVTTEAVLDELFSGFCIGK